MIGIKSHFAFLDIIEINLMSILFSSVILISIDRLACVLLRVRYNYYITESLVKGHFNYHMVSWAYPQGVFNVGISSDHQDTPRFFII